MAELVIAIDFGSSKAKIIYCRDNIEVQSITLNPDIQKISENQLQSQKSQIDFLNLEDRNDNDRIWIQSNEEIFAVGEFATQLKYDDNIQEKKYEAAIEKTLGIIGFIASKENLLNPGKRTTKVQLSLGILLPWEELSDQELFREELHKKLNRFFFKEYPISVKLKHFIYLPEAGGLARARLIQKGKKWIQNQKILLLMLGHRNLTLLYMNQGKIEQGESPKIGLFRCLDQVAVRHSDISRDILAKAMFQSLAELIYEDIRASQKSPYSKRKNCGFVYQIFKSESEVYSQTSHPDWKELPEIQKLCTAKRASLRSKELEKLNQAINQALSAYWDLIVSKLNEFDINNIDEVILSGGASLLLQPELETYFNCQPKVKITEGGQQQRIYRTNQYAPKDEEKNFTNLLWGSELECLTLAQLCQSQSIEELRTKIPTVYQLLMTTRFADVASLFEYLKAVVTY